MQGGWQSTVAVKSYQVLVEGRSVNDKPKLCADDPLNLFGADLHTSHSKSLSPYARVIIPDVEM
jgi:hypothetical protein